MRQRREDAKNIAIIIGSGALGFATALLGAPLVRPTAEVVRPEARVQALELRLQPPVVAHQGFRQLRLQPTWTWEREATRPGRLRAVWSLRTEDGETPYVLGMTPEVRRGLVARERDKAERIRQLAALGMTKERDQAERIRIRGSATANTAKPVVYVDGVRIQGSLEAVVSETIRHMDIIPGSQAVREYGKEGENGVILVTTEKRKGGDGS